MEYKPEMSEQDEATTDTDDVANIDAADSDADTTAEQTTSEKTYTTADLERIIERRLERERAKYADYDKLKADALELAQLNEATKAELDKAAERIAEAEKRAAEADFNALRNKVAAIKGVPPSSLVGETEDELNASADELLAWAGSKQATAPAKRSPSTSSGLKSGATGVENTNHDPKAAAADALRRLRQTG